MENNEYIRLSLSIHKINILFKNKIIPEEIDFILKKAIETNKYLNKFLKILEEDKSTDSYDKLCNKIKLEILKKESIIYSEILEKFHKIYEKETK